MLLYNLPMGGPGSLALTQGTPRDSSEASAGVQPGFLVPPPYTAQQELLQGLYFLALPIPSPVRTGAYRKISFTRTFHLSPQNAKTQGPWEL